MIRQRFSKFFSFILLAFALISCLSPSGENFIQIEEPDLSSITLDLQGEVDDPIIIDRETEFRLEVSGYSLHIEESEVKLNDIPVSAGGSSTFFVFPPNYASGAYKLHIKVVGRTNNGSLADILDVERVELEREYNVIIDADPPPVIEITKIDTVGTVTIHWNKYSRSNFKNYEIVKICQEDQNYVSCKNVTITDSTVNSWTDSEFTGGHASYRINISTFLHTTPGMPKEYSWSPHFNVSLNNGVATVKWHRPPFNLNVLKATIRTQPAIPFETETTDTVYVSDRLLFGSVYNLELKLHSSTPTITAKFSQNYFVGTKSGWPSAFPKYFHPTEKLFYGQNNLGTVVMDNNLKVLTSTHLPLSFYYISNNGQYFITQRSSNQLYFTDPHTLDVSLFYHEVGASIGVTRVADNGLIGYHANGVYRVMDLATNEIKFQDVPYVSSYSMLSPSGKYLIAKDKKVYQYNGSSFDLTGTLPTDFNPYGTMAFASNDNILANIQNAQGSVDFVEFEISTLSIINSKNVNAYINLLQIDPISKKMLVMYNNRHYILNDARELKQVSPYSINLLTFFDNRLFTGDDFYTYSIDASYIEQP